MKKNLIVVFVLLFVSCTNYFAQSIGFGHPSNNAIYASTAYGSTSSTVPVQMLYSFTQTPPQGTTVYVIKLFAEGNEYDDVQGKTPGIPQWFYLSAGQRTWTLELWEMPIGGQVLSKTATATVTFYVKFTLYVANNFNSGSISLDGSTVSSGSSTLKYIGNVVSVGAIDQSSGGYNMVWNTSGTNISNWQRNGANIYGATSRNLSYTVASNDNGTTLTAFLYKLYQATFQSPDQITINGANYYQSGTVGVVEGNTATASVSSLITSSDWIYYNFVNWTWSGGSSTNTTITPTLTANTTYTANYTASTANPQPMNIRFTSTDGAVH